MGASQRRKGASGERELCSIFADEFGIAVKRNLGQARDSGHDISLPGFAIEVKRRKRIAGLYDWIGQCKGGVPAVAVRADGKEWLVVMPLRDWCELARDAIAGNEQ